MDNIIEVSQLNLDGTLYDLRDNSVDNKIKTAVDKCKETIPEIKPVQESESYTLAEMKDVEAVQNAVNELSDSLSETIGGQIRDYLTENPVVDENFIQNSETIQTMSTEIADIKKKNRNVDEQLDFLSTANNIINGDISDVDKLGATPEMDDVSELFQGKNIIAKQKNYKVDKETMLSLKDKNISGGGSVVWNEYKDNSYFDPQYLMTGETKLEYIHDPVYMSMKEPSEAISEYMSARTNGALLYYQPEGYTNLIGIGALYAAEPDNLPDEFIVCLGALKTYTLSDEPNAKWILHEEHKYPLGLTVYELPWTTHVSYALEEGQIEYCENHVKLHLKKKDLTNSVLHFWGSSKRIIDLKHTIGIVVMYEVWTETENLTGGVFAATGADQRIVFNSGSNNVKQAMSGKNWLVKPEHRLVISHNIPDKIYDELKYTANDPEKLVNAFYEIEKYVEPIEEKPFYYTLPKKCIIGYSEESGNYLKICSVAYNSSDLTLFVNMGFDIDVISQNNYNNKVKKEVNIHLMTKNDTVICKVYSDVNDYITVCNDTENKVVNIYIQVQAWTYTNLTLRYLAGYLELLTFDDYFVSLFERNVFSNLKENNLTKELIGEPVSIIDTNINIPETTKLPIKKISPLNIIDVFKDNIETGVKYYNVNGWITAFENEQYIEYLPPVFKNQIFTVKVNYWYIDAEKTRLFGEQTWVNLYDGTTYTRTIANGVYKDWKIIAKLDNENDTIVTDEQLNNTMEELSNNLPNTIDERINNYLTENPPVCDVPNEQINNAVNNYLTENPLVCDVPDTQVDNAVHNYLIVNPPTGGATNVQVEEAVNGYFEKNEINDKILNNPQINTVDLSFIEGSYINAVGTVCSMKEYIYSNPFYIEQGLLKFKAKGYSNNVAILSTCNKDGTNIKPIIVSEDNLEHEFTYEVKNSGYFMVSSKGIVEMHNYLASVNENIKNIKENITIINNKLENEEIKDELELIDFVLKDDFYVSKVDGAFGDYSKYGTGVYKATDYIPIVPNSILEIKNGKVYNNNAGHAFYDDKKNFIEGITTTDVNMIVEVPQNAYFICLTYNDGMKIINKNVLGNIVKNHLIKKETDEINEQPLNNLLYSGGFLSCFETIGCIGDSLTAGNVNYNGETSGEYVNDYTSYPYNLARMTGSTVRKFAMGGATATDSELANTQYHSWLKIANNSNNNWLSEENKCQCYIIALGTNDIGYYGSFDGNVDTDIDMNDCENNAKTSVGSYAKIIQKIYALQPKAKIFCVTLPTSRNNMTTRSVANTAIKAIANKLNCYVIDLETYRTISSNEMREKYYNGGHLNALGYNYLAREILTYTDYIIKTNYNDFQDIQFIDTEYSYTD